MKGPSKWEMEEGGDGRMEGATGAALTPPRKRPRTARLVTELLLQEQDSKQPKRETTGRPKEQAEILAAAHRGGDGAGV